MYLRISIVKWFHFIVNPSYMFFLFDGFTSYTIMSKEQSRLYFIFLSLECNSLPEIPDYSYIFLWLKYFLIGLSLFSKPVYANGL